MFTTRPSWILIAFAKPSGSSPSFPILSTISLSLSLVLTVQAHGFFKGMSYPILAAGALNSIYFGVYGGTLRLLTDLRSNNNGENGLKNHAQRKDGTKDSGGTSAAVKGARAQTSKVDVFVAGCAGGAAQLVVACPVDLVKIKLQTQTGKMRGPSTIAAFEPCHFRNSNMNEYDILFYKNL